MWKKYSGKFENFYRMSEFDFEYLLNKIVLTEIFSWSEMIKNIILSIMNKDEILLQ